MSGSEAVVVLHPPTRRKPDCEASKHHRRRRHDHNHHKIQPAQTQGENDNDRRPLVVCARNNLENTFETATHTHHRHATTTCPYFSSSLTIGSEPVSWAMCSAVFFLKVRNRTSNVSAAAEAKHHRQAQAAQAAHTAHTAHTAHGVSQLCLCRHMGGESPNAQKAQRVKRVARSS